MPSDSYEEQLSWRAARQWRVGTLADESDGTVLLASWRFGHGAGPGGPRFHDNRRIPANLRSPCPMQARFMFSVAGRTAVSRFLRAPASAHALY